MSLNNVTLSGNLGAQSWQEGGYTLTFTPSAAIQNTTSNITYFNPIVTETNLSGAWSASLLANDSTGLLPVGWYWTLVVTNTQTGAQVGSPFSFEVYYGTGASQTFASMVQLFPEPSLATSQLAKAYAQAGRMIGMGYMGAVSDYYTTSLAAATWSSKVLFISRIDCAVVNASVNGYVSLQWYNQNAGLANSYIALYNSSGVQLGITGDLSSQTNNTWIRVRATGFTSTPSDGVVFAVYQNGTQAVAAGPGALGFGFYDVPIQAAQYTPSVTGSGPTNIGYGGSFYYTASNSLPSSLPMTGWTVTNVLPWISVD
jgi:hypothetical protein